MPIRTAALRAEAPPGGGGGPPDASTYRAINPYRLAPSHGLAAREDSAAPPSGNMGKGGLGLAKKIIL